MENTNVKFFTEKEEEKEERVPSLKFYCARLVYYINLNIMYNLHKAVVFTYNCSCWKFSGCKRENGFLDYCDFCSLNIKHNPFDNEKNFKIKDIINKHIELIEDFKIYNIDIDNDDYTFKTWSPYHFIYSFYDSVFNDSLFINKKTFY